MSNIDPCAVLSPVHMGPDGRRLTTGRSTSSSTPHGAAPGSSGGIDSPENVDGMVQPDTVSNQAWTDLLSTPSTFLLTDVWTPSLVSMTEKYTNGTVFHTFSYTVSGSIPTPGNANVVLSNWEFNAMAINKNVTATYLNFNFTPYSG